MASLIAIDKSTTPNGWAERHNSALVYRHNTEGDMVRMLKGWEAYAVVHKHRYETAIGEDCILGPAWAEIGRSLLTLLNGELGRLDAGTCDAFIRDVMKENGVEVEE